MRTMIGSKQRSLVLTGLGMAIAMSALVAAPIDPAPPEPVLKTFKANFPEAKLTAVVREVEDGVSLYKATFTVGEVGWYAAIAADGTQIETGHYIPEKDVPEVAMKAIRKEAAGTVIVKIARLEVTHDTLDGKVTKLPAPETEYEAQLAKTGSLGYVSIASDGSVVEPLEWEKQH